VASFDLCMSRVLLRASRPAPEAKDERRLRGFSAPGKKNNRRDGTQARAALVTGQLQAQARSGVQRNIQRVFFHCVVSLDFALPPPSSVARAFLVRLAPQSPAPLSSR
jgi:hypothetical protein